MKKGSAVDETAAIGFARRAIADGRREADSLRAAAAELDDGLDVIECALFDPAVALSI
jgi:hypothetical protein